ncbi:MAG: glycosyltransferase family 39 protein [Chloroflexi bacterium]|nr:glycosyltransferase family 39 protein [Chloroflexota bacterium]
MSTLISQAMTTETVTAKTSRWSRARAFEWIALAAIIALAAALRLANLSALGDANHYYTAAVEAMSQSWHNFFFAAAEPGGAVSVDKPPVGLWFQVISAYFFGVNGFGVLLPQIMAGILSVFVVYRLVRKPFGVIAGLVAGLALAITPVAVATDRNNTMDSTLILTLLLAAWAFLEATQRGTRSVRYLILGSLLVGIGFNIKMLQAYLPAPAFYALYVLGSPERWWRKSANLALAVLVLLAVSLSWTIAVDLTPEDQRPYVGSSGDNSVLSLITGYNGTQRLLGLGGRGFLSGIFGGNQNSGGQNGTPGQSPTGAPQGFQPPRDGDDRQPPQGFQPTQGQNAPQGGPGGPGGGGGMFNTGQPGAWRLFTTPLSKETSWLLPFGLFSGLLLIFRARVRLPIAPKHQAVVLWGGWLVTAGIFFSVAGFFHEYYLAMLAPALAALVGIGAAELWQLRAKHAWLALGLFIVAASGTLYVQITTANAYVKNAWWLPLVIALGAVGIALWIPGFARRFKFAAPAGLACLLAAMLLTPGIWSGLTTFYSSGNQSLPAAYDGRSSGPPNQGGAQTNQTLLSYLQANTQGIKYLLAVPSSMQGADYVLATGRPVLYLGGFNGQDKVVTSEELTQMVANNELRFIYYDTRGGGGGPGGNQSEISSWVSRACTLVGFDTASSNFGAPDGTGATNNTTQSFRDGGPSGMQVSLYDCKPK